MIRKQAKVPTRPACVALSATLKQARTQRKFSQADVARWLGWSRGRVARYEGASVKRMCVFDVRALCRLLSLDFVKVIEACANSRALSAEECETLASALARTKGSD